MSIINSHDISLYGGNSMDIVLSPLHDNHLPLLYRWNSDPEVVYWSDTGNTNQFSEEEVRGMYAYISANALCFLITVDGTPVGDLWLQKMNLPEISAKYPHMDVRRIDATIGEKTLWGKGIGTAALRMLIDFAFYGEHADILYCIAADYNLRSQKTLLKNGFILTDEKELLENSLRAKKEYHYVLSRQEFINRHRNIVLPEKRFELPINSLQPSQLFISDGKLRLVWEWFDSSDKQNFDPIPIKLLDDNLLITDGHTRAVAAHLAGWDTISVYWDNSDLDMRAYAIDVQWCKKEAIQNPSDLTNRIVSHKEYERLWRKRCMEMVIE